jgi:hypothetical protein
MVLQVLADAGEMLDHFDAVLLQERAVTDTGELQNLRRGHGSSRQHNLSLGANTSQSAALPELDANSALSLEENARDMGVRLHLEVGAGQGGLEEAARRRPAATVPLVDMEVGNALVAARVEIINPRNARLNGCIDEPVQKLPLHARGVHTPFSACAMVLACAEIMVQVTAEEGLHIVPTPAHKAHLPPVVVILALAAHVDHGVDGRAAAQDLAPRVVQHTIVQAGLRFGLEHPVSPGIADGEEIADGDVKPDPVILPARFEQADGVAWIHGEAVRQNAACRTSADDHIIKCLTAWHKTTPSTGTDAGSIGLGLIRVILDPGRSHVFSAWTRLLRRK